MNKSKYIFIIAITLMLFSISTPVLANTEPSIKPLQNKQVYSGDKVRVRANVSDANDDALAFYWTQEAGDAVQFRGAYTDTLVFTAPQVTQSTEYLFKLAVSDGQSNSEATVKILVEPKSSSSPMANAGSDQNVLAEELVTLDASFSEDADSLALTFVWTQTAGPQVQFSPTQAKTTFFAPQVATETLLTFQVEVSDGEQSNSDTVNITVQPRAMVESSQELSQVDTPDSTKVSMDTSTVEVPVVLFIDAPTTAKAGDTVQLKSSILQPGVTYFWRVANYPLLVEDSDAPVTTLSIPQDFNVGKEIIIEHTIYTDKEMIKKQHAILIVGTTSVVSTINPTEIPVQPTSTAVSTISGLSTKSIAIPLPTIVTPATNLQTVLPSTVPTNVQASILTTDTDSTMKNIITAILLATGIFCVIYGLFSRKKTALADVTIYDQRK